MKKNNEELIDIKKTLKNFTEQEEKNWLNFQLIYEDYKSYELHKGKRMLKSERDLLFRLFLMFDKNIDICSYIIDKCGFEGKKTIEDIYKFAQDWKEQGIISIEDAYNTEKIPFNTTSDQQKPRAFFVPFHYPEEFFGDYLDLDSTEHYHFVFFKGSPPNHLIVLYSNLPTWDEAHKIISDMYNIAVYITQDKYQKKTIEYAKKTYDITDEYINQLIKIYKDRHRFQMLIWAYSSQHEFCIKEVGTSPNEYYPTPGTLPTFLQDEEESCPITIE